MKSIYIEDVPTPLRKTANDMTSNPDVLGELHAAILRGEYAPRQRLVEADLVERYGASRFTVRDALTKLAGQGLVELQSNKGARVREVSLEEALEITEIRRAVEGLVAYRAAEKITDEQAAELEELGRSMTEAVASGELMIYSEMNGTLHSALRTIAAHDSATRIIEQLNGQMVRHQFTLSLVPGRSAVSLEQHLEIIQAVVAKDPERAELAMRTHINSVIEAIKKFDAGATIRLPGFGQGMAL
jgi:DNA-binding GntR family transcriptional regulator